MLNQFGVKRKHTRSERSYKSHITYSPLPKTLRENHTKIENTSVVTSYLFTVFSYMFYQRQVSCALFNMFRVGLLESYSESSVNIIIFMNIQ